VSDTKRLNRRAIAYWSVGAGLLIVGVFMIFRTSDRQATPPSSPDRLSSAELSHAYAALCRSRAEVGGDPAQASEIFYGEAHTTLHVLAQQIGEDDRQMAASILEAKNAVETTLASGAPGPAAAALDRLLDTLEQALLSLGVEPPSCSANAPERHS
jgi:hypothetical protein